MTTTVIRDVRIPACLAAPGLLPVDEEEMLRADLFVEDGRIAALLPAGAASPETTVLRDHRGGLAFPLFADIHTHLDKTFIWDRAPNPDGTFAGALATVAADREAFWTRDDVRRRMDFALRCAYTHGTGLIRTHLDTFGAHGERVWPLFRDIQRDWAGRITLQATALVTLDRYLGDDAFIRAVAETPGGQLGAVIMHDSVTPEGLAALFDAADRYGLDLDLHVDENGIVGETALEAVADAALARHFRGRILCGHCCSLSRQTPDRQRRIVAKVRDAGIGVVSLPGCNLYLQDRVAGITPQWRGVTLLHELHAAGVPVMIASDNVRDPFFAYGDYDMLGVFADAVRIGHLDAPFGDWPQAIITRPAAWCGRDFVVRPGMPADLVLCEARTLNELISRPSAPRHILRDGTLSDAPLPDYRDLHAT